MASSQLSSNLRASNLQTTQGRSLHYKSHQVVLLGGLNTTPNLKHFVSFLQFAFSGNPRSSPLTVGLFGWTRTTRAGKRLLTENLWCRLILIHTPGLRTGESGGWFSEIYLSRHILSPNHLERQNIWPLGMLVVVLVRLGLSWKVPLFLTGWHPLDELWMGNFGTSWYW